MAAKKSNTTKKTATSVVPAICAELKIDLRIARRRLRAAGMSAPYDDSAAVRKVLTKA